MQNALLWWYNFFNMEESDLIRLDLRAPLEYAEANGLDPFDSVVGENKTSQEMLFCFELNKEQGNRIDPDADHFLGKLLFSGRENNGQSDPQTSNLSLPAGLYLFAQQRRVLSREECIYLAIEQQKDGLWERLRLESLLYIRRLFEDGSEVTQLFRPCSVTNHVS